MWFKFNQRGNYIKVNIFDKIQQVYKNYPTCKSEIKYDVFREIAKCVISNISGEILEIGAYQGDATKVFLEEAAKFGKTVHVIDPWNGQQQGTDKAYQEFLKNTSKFENLKVLKVPSQSKEAWEYVSGLNLSLALIDGLHTKSAAYNDIALTRKAIFSSGIVIVDDVRDLYSCLGDLVCGDIMKAVIENEDSEWRHVLSPPDWLCTIYIK